MQANSLAFTLAKLSMAAGAPLASLVIAHAPPRVETVQALEAPSIVEVEKPLTQFPATRDGYYYAPAFANGHSIRMLVDSGANITVLSNIDARAAGINLPSNAYRERLVTANGASRIAIVTIKDLTIAEKRFSRLRVAVAKDNRVPSLLGSDALSHFQQITINDGVLELRA